MLHFMAGPTSGSSCRPDRWIIGNEVDSGNEYIIHLAEPGFVAKFWEGEESEVPPQSTGTMFDIGGCIFYDIQWFGNEPDEGLQTALLIEAVDAIDRFTDYDCHDGYDD